MTLDNDDLINSIIASLDRIENIRLEDIPNIDLYMDQLTTFMDEKLIKTTRNPGEDKILTKTMINNYAKNDLLPPPVRKKYSKDHVILLLFIYYLKSVLTINDVQTLLEPLKERFHISDTDKLTLSDIYSMIFDIEDKEVEPVKKDVLEKARIAATTFEDAPDDMKEKMQLFSFLALLSYDVYVKKLIIEKVIDGINDKNGKSVAKADKKMTKEEKRAAKAAAKKK
jgi:DNA-binding transcriptional MerR regulator